MVARWCRISQPPSTGGSPTSSQDDFILLGLSKRVPRLANLVERSDAMALWPRGSGDGGWWMDVASRFLGGQCVYIYIIMTIVIILYNAIYIYLYSICVHLYVLICTCMYLYALICAYMYLYVLTFTYMHSYRLICTCMHLYVLMYFYVRCK